jgi:hypothetical protein
MDLNVHYDRLICLTCNYREISRHNITCPTHTNQMMVYELAAQSLNWVKPDRQLELEQKWSI